MTHPTDEELDALDAKLASQIGDDVAVIFNHEYLFKQSRIAIAALRAQLADARENARWAYVKAALEDNQDELAEANARADRAEAALAALAASIPADPVINAGCCQALLAERDDLRAKLDEAVGALEEIAAFEVFSMGIGIDPRPTNEAKIARATLAKIKGADHE